MCTMFIITEMCVNKAIVIHECMNGCVDISRICRNGFEFITSKTNETAIETAPRNDQSANLEYP